MSHLLLRVTEAHLWRTPGVAAGCKSSVRLCRAEAATLTRILLRSAHPGVKVGLERTLVDDHT